MNKQAPAPILRIFPSLTDLAFLAPILLLFARLDGVKTMLGDGDTGWHIRAGDWMLDNGRVPTKDLFSLTMSDAPWFAWEWLSEVLMALLHRQWGLAGVAYAGILVLCFTSASLFRLCRRHTTNDLLAIAITIVAVAASSIHWLARPHLLTMLFVTVALHLLDRAYLRPSLLWWFPPMIVLWANLHAAFLVGIIFLLTAGTGLLLRELTSSQFSNIKQAWTASGTYFTVAAISTLSTIINPYGWNLHLHIYKYLNETYHFDHIGEFQTLNFHAPIARFVEVLIFFGLLAVGWSIVRRRFVDALLLISWLHFALQSGRNIAIYSLVAAPVVVRFITESSSMLANAPVAPWLSRLSSGIQNFGTRFSLLDRLPRLHLPSIAVSLSLFIMILGAPLDANKLKAEFDQKRYPYSALSMLEGRRVFTNDEWGDYLIYMLYPKQKVFVDGRSDFYGSEFSLKYLDVMNCKWDWESILHAHRINAILLPADAQLAATLKVSKDWKLVHDDHISVLFFASATGSPSSSVPDSTKVVSSAQLPGFSEENLLE